MKSFQKIIAIFLTFSMIFPLAISPHGMAASSIQIEYEEEHPTLTPTENQGRNSTSGGNVGDSDIPSDSPGGIVPDFLRDLWDWGTDMIEEGVNQLQDWIQEGGEALANLIGDIGRAFGDFVSTFAPNLGERITEYSNQLESLITTLTNPDSFLDFLEGLARALFFFSPIGFTAVTLDLLANGLVDLWNAMPDWLQGLLKGIAIGVLVAALIVAGAYALLALGAIALGTFLTVTLLAGIGALASAIYGAIVGGENFNPWVAGGIVFAVVFIPLSGKISSALLSTRVALMLGVRGQLAFSWVLSKLATGWGALSAFLVKYKTGFLIGGLLSSFDQINLLFTDPSSFSLKSLLVDVVTGAAIGGLVAPLAGGFLSLNIAEKLRRVLTASGIGGTLLSLNEWVLDGSVSLSTFVTGALVTGVFFGISPRLLNITQRPFTGSLVIHERNIAALTFEFTFGHLQNTVNKLLKEPIANGFNFIGDKLSNGWDRLFNGNLNNVEHLDTEELQREVENKSS